MTLLQRRLLFYFFILLFIAVVPVVLLYATGRTVNWRRLELQKTASIMAESEPAGAQIFLDGQQPSTLLGRLFGKQTPATTPAKLPDLAPGSYTLRFESPGYFPWEQAVTVRPGEVFHTGSIRLFKDDIPELIAGLDNGRSVTSPDGRTIVISGKDSLSIFSVAESKNAIVTLADISPEAAISWSKNQDMLLYAERYVISLDGRLLFDIESLPNKATMPRWDAENNERLYFFVGNAIFRLNLDSKKNEKASDLSPALGGQTIADYEPAGRQIYVITDSRPQNLIIVNPSAPDRANLTALPVGEYSFRRAGQEYVLILDNRSQNLYRVEQPFPLIPTHRIVRVAESFTAGRWADNRLIYATPFEARLWGDDSGRFVSRFSEAIADIAFVPKDDYAIFITKNNIYILPLSGTRAGVASLLTETEKLTALVSVSQHELYFTGSVAGEYGLYRLSF